jgi:hypothetical protein
MSLFTYGVKQCPTFSRWQLLSAAQAMALFVLLRLSYSSNHPAFPDADIALLFSLRVSTSSFSSYPVVPFPLSRPKIHCSHS